MKELQEVFDLEEDLFRATEDRNIPFRLRNKKIIYLNKDQFDLMMEEYQKERQERYMNSRCLISAKIGNLKRCRNGKCEECSIYKNSYNGTVSLMLDSLEEHSSVFIDEGSNIVRSINEKELHEEVFKVLNELDIVEKVIIQDLMDSVSITITAKKLNVSKSAVSQRKTKLLEKLKNNKDIINIFKNYLS